MNGLVPVLLVGAVLLFIVLGLMNMKPGRAAKFPVEPKPLMTATERQVIAMLEEALPAARVHAKIALGAIIKTSAGLSQRERMSVRGRFSQKIVDFVLEDRASGHILALVEQGNRSSDAGERAKRDAITGSAGYKTIRLPDTRRPSATGVRDVVLAALSDHAGTDNTSAPQTRGDGAKQREVTA
ncbi:DUF2726 domain-containing protein [uncultured Sphingomonas sp.]|uniref:DUF2726 domain-containing protein n=1 Tax=uncultured Sphingomonas sp. TaxID=158754 RepID=UPI0025CE46C1|nr:DUF2726 domain-containing protein [uncultured Sphingomonas sp.]